MNFHLKDGLTEDLIYRQANARGSTDVISIFFTRTTASRFVHSNWRHKIFNINW